MAGRSKQAELNLNAATVQQLQQVEGISAERAQLLIEERDKAGGFQSWEEVQKVPGFSDEMIEMLKAGAALGITEQGDTTQSVDAASEAADEADEAADEEEETETEVDALLALAQMDSEAATSYETAAEMVPEPSIQTKLMEFAGDHRRHVEELGRLISSMGITPEIAAPAPDSSVFNMLESAIATLGTRPALLALFGTEQFTNVTYQTAVELVEDPNAVALLERNYGDEQRHLAWIVEQKDKLEQEEEAEGEMASAP